MHAAGSSSPLGFGSPQVVKPQTPRSQSSRILKWLLICGLVFGAVMLALFGTCIYVGVRGPDTRVLPGRQVPARFMAQIRRLDLLDPGEQIQYFYSDALLNIEEGMYFLTDHKVVIYSRSFDDPTVIIPFSEVADVEATFSDSWFEDSIITLRLADDTYTWFPVSSEGGGDKKVYETLKKKCTGSE